MHATHNAQHCGQQGRPNSWLRQLFVRPLPWTLGLPVNRANLHTTLTFLLWVCFLGNIAWLVSLLPGVIYAASTSNGFFQLFLRMLLMVPILLVFMASAGFLLYQIAKHRSSKSLRNSVIVVFIALLCFSLLGFVSYLGSLDSL